MGDMWLPDKVVSMYVIQDWFNVLEHNWELHGIDNYFKLLLDIQCGLYYHHRILQRITREKI